MKKSISIVLIVLLLSQILNRVWIIFTFQINQKYIIENFCENKDKPLMECNGKCHLNKQIKATEEQESQIPQNLKNTFELLYCSNDVAIIFERKSTQIVPNAMNGFYLQAKSFSKLVDIFHPPQFQS